MDIGVHVNGRICDSAFTLNFEPTYDKLIEAVKAATETGVRVRRFFPQRLVDHVPTLVQEAGIDMQLGELAGYIQETMESYEVEVGGKVFPVKPISNLSGHSINKYEIHGGKSVGLVKSNDPTKMEEGEYFAIETFGSTGRGKIIEAVCFSPLERRWLVLTFIAGRVLSLRQKGGRPACPITVRYRCRRSRLSGTD